MEIHGILFDLDGTLANTLPLCIKIYRQTLQHFTGRPYTESEVTAHFGLTEVGIFQRMIPRHWEPAMQHYLESYQQHHYECEAPFPGIEAALQLLQARGIRLAVVTGKDPRTAALTLKYLHIAQYFSSVEAGRPDEVVKAKAISRILADWQMEPAHAAYVGDTLLDMQEATLAGVLPLGAAWAETATPALAASPLPFTTFSTVKDFISWLDKHTERSGPLQHIG